MGWGGGEGGAVPTSYADARKAVVRGLVALVLQVCVCVCVCLCVCVCGWMGGCVVFVCILDPYMDT